MLTATLLAGSTLAFAQAPETVAPPDPQQQGAAPEPSAPPAVNDQNTSPSAPPDSGNQAAPVPQSANPQYGPPQPNSGPVYPQANQQPPVNSPGNYGQAPYAYPQQGYPQQPYPPPYAQQQPPYAQGQGTYPRPYGQQGPYQQAPMPVPAQLTITPGTYVTVRINQQLTSDRNRQGDAFTATLVDPVVVNGVVIAEPGETVGGVVADVEKGATSRLMVQLTDLTLADGARVPVETKLVARRGPGFNGRDAGTIVGTTAIGAAVGGAAAWGTGAAVGAGVGLVVGALITHNHPSVIYPEQILTFRIDVPVAVSTQNAPQAFHYIQPGEYDRPSYASGPAPGYSAAPVPYYGAYGYPYAYPYAYGYWGPSVSFFFGNRGYYGYHRPYYGGRVVVRR